MYEQLIEASTAFYEWEELRYSGNSPLSDDDKQIWMQGYVYASELIKHKNSLADTRTPDELYNFLDDNGIEYEFVEQFEGVRILSIEVAEPEEEEDETGTTDSQQDA